MNTVIFCYQSQYAAWVANSDYARWDIFSDYAACTNNGTFTNYYACANCRVRPNPNIIFYGDRCGGANALCSLLWVDRMTSTTYAYPRPNKNTSTNVYW